MTQNTLTHHAEIDIQTAFPLLRLLNPKQYTRIVLLSLAVRRLLDEIDRTRPVVCVCHHGMRSLQVAVYLERNGFAQVGNLAGGIDAWSRDADPACPTY